MISCIWGFARGEGGGGGAAKSAGRFYCLFYIAYDFTWTTWTEKLTTLWDLLCQMAVSVSCLTYGTVCTWSPRNTYLMDLWQKAYSRTKIKLYRYFVPFRVQFLLTNFLPNPLLANPLASLCSPHNNHHCKKKPFPPPPSPASPWLYFWNK